MINHHDVIEVTYPNEVLKKMNVDTIITSPIHKNIGVAILSNKGMKSKESLIKIFSIHKNANETKFQITHELQSFLFSDESTAKKFIDHLPHMSAIELMFTMEGIQFH